MAIDGVVGEELHEAQDLAQRLARLVAGKDQVGDGDGAGIDEGIARPAALVFELDDRIERAARRLAADALPQPVADLAEREREREYLRDALDGEGRVGIAAHGDMAFAVDHGHAETVRTHARQFRDVVGDLAAIRALPDFLGDVRHDLLKVCHGITCASRTPFAVTFSKSFERKPFKQGTRHWAPTKKKGASLVGKRPVSRPRLGAKVGGRP